MNGKKRLFVSGIIFGLIGLVSLIFCIYGIWYELSPHYHYGIIDLTIYGIVGSAVIAVVFCALAVILLKKSKKK